MIVQKTGRYSRFGFRLYRNVAPKPFEPKLFIRATAADRLAEHIESLRTDVRRANDRASAYWNRKIELEHRLGMID